MFSFISQFSPLSFVLLGISGVALLYCLWAVVSHFRLLSTTEWEVSKSYSATYVFLHTCHYLLRIFLRAVARGYKVCVSYVILVVLKVFNFFQYISDALYSRMRNYFVRKSVEDKSLVIHFWGHLKKYKKEMDKEEEKD